MKMLRNIFVLFLLLMKTVNFSFSQNDIACGGFNAMLIEDPVGCNNDTWYLVFEDNFNGTELDFSKWTVPYQGVNMY